MASRHASAGFRRELIHVLPSPIHLPSPRTDRLPWTPEHRTLIFCGRLVAHKGTATLLHAMRWIDKPWRLRVVGDGRDATVLRRLSSTLELQNRVDFLGHIPRDKLHGLFYRAAALVVPSIWPEPLGMVGPEALASGCAVVASDIGGITEWLVDEVTGLAARPGDPEDLARQVNRLLRDPELAVRLTRAGRELVEQRFVFPSHVDTLVDVFEAAIEAHRDRICVGD